jgi:hypothetical protein
MKLYFSIQLTLSCLFFSSFGLCEEKINFEIFSNFESLNQKPHLGMSKPLALYRHKQTQEIWAINLKSVSMDDLRYFLAAPLWKVVLGNDRAPTVSFVKDDEGKFHLKTKWLDDFKPMTKLDSILGSSADPDYFTSQSLSKTEQEVKNAAWNQEHIVIKDFMKMIAFTFIIGDWDPNLGNIGYISKSHQYFASKVDHDNSFNKMETSSLNDIYETMRPSIQPAMNQRLGYLKNMIIGFEALQPIQSHLFEHEMKHSVEYLHKLNIITGEVTDQFQVSDEYIKTLYDGFLKRWNLIPFYLQSLHAEVAVLENDVMTIKDIIYSDLHFDSMYIGNYRKHLSLMELAICHNKEKIVDLLMKKNEERMIKNLFTDGLYAAAFCIEGKPFFKKMKGHLVPQDLNIQELKVHGLKNALIFTLFEDFFPEILKQNAREMIKYSVENPSIDSYLNFKNKEYYKINTPPAVMKNLTKKLSSEDANDLAKWTLSLKERELCFRGAEFVARYLFSRLDPNEQKGYLRGFSANLKDCEINQYFVKTLFSPNFVEKNSEFLKNLLDELDPVSSKLIKENLTHS